MYKSESNTNPLGELITLKQACETLNLGLSTVRELAKSSGAVRKIGGCYRIKRKILLDYIEEHYAN